MTPGLAKCMCHFGFVVAAGVMLSLPAEAVTITVGEDKTVVSMDWHEMSFADDPGNLLPWPEDRQATSSGNTASVKLTATPGRAGMAAANIGLNLNWDAGTNSLAEAMAFPVLVTIDVSYELQADWVEGHGSANATVSAFALLDEKQGRIVWKTGARSDSKKITLTTTPGQLGGSIPFFVACQAHSTPEEAPYPLPGTVHTSRAKVTVKSITFEFLKPEFEVVDVTSPYCSKQEHAYFLRGIPFAVEFTATVNWNGRTPGSIEFKTPSSLLSGSGDKRTLDVGSLNIGDTLTVTAFAEDGVRSKPFRANFDVFPIPVPLYEGPGGSIGFSQGKYRVNVKQPQNLFRLDAGTESIPNDDNGKEIPGCTGKRLKFGTELTLGGTISLDGSWQAKVEGSQNNEKYKWDMPGFSTKPSVYGGIEGKYSGTDWAIGGFAGVKVKVNYVTPPYYFWIAPPIYGQFAARLDQTLEGHIEYNPSEGIHSYGTFPGSLHMEGIAGFGLDSVVYAEVYGGGGPYWQLQWPKTPPLDKWGVDLYVGVRWGVLCFASADHKVMYTWAAPSGSMKLTGGSGTEGNGSMNRPVTSEFKLLPRDYVTNSYAVSGLSQSSQMRLLGQGSGGSMMADFNVLQANIYPYSEPALAASCSNRLMVWIWDNPDRSAENRTELVSAKWTGEGWSNPTSVWNEGTADFSPSVAVFCDGKALATWQNERASLTNGATLDEALAGLEVAASQYDPETGIWTSTNLTDNTFIDRNPQLAGASNGTALLTWISNPSNDMNGTITNLNTIVSRRWTGAEWVDDGDIVTNARMLLWYTLAYDGSTGMCVAAIDGDDDQSTVDDQELFGATFDGPSWGPFVQLTTNGVQDTKPQAVFDYAGNLLVVWYQGSNLVMHAGDLVLNSSSVVAEVGGTSSAKDFKLVTGPAGQISMVWTGLAEDGTGPDPFMLNYDTTLGLWSKPIRLMNNTNLLERSFAGAYSTNGSLLLAYNQVHIQTDTNGFPVFTNNVVDLVFMDYLIGGDLGLESSDISLSTNHPVAGQGVDIFAVVHNLGELAATNIAVSFFDGNPVSGGGLIGSTQTVAQLVAGDSTNVQVSWLIPLTGSNQTVYVVVDPALAQEDRNRANNTASMIALSPDLALSEMAVLNTATNQRIVIARVVNEGAFSSGRGFDVTFRRGSTNGPLLATSTIDSLPAGGQDDVNFEWHLAGSTFTDAFETVYAVADPSGSIAELETGNNVGMVQVMTSLDTDSDGLLDGEEMRYGSSISMQDSDGDGLKDGEEVHVYVTSPVLADSDADGAKDGDEVRAGTDPNSAADTFAITGVDRETGLALVHWSAKMGKFYQVAKSVELLTWTNAPNGAGTDQQSRRKAMTDGVLQYVDPESTATSTAFYKVNLSSIGILAAEITSIDVPRVLPDVSSAFSSNVVQISGGGTISNLSVLVRLDHTWDGDLVLALQHPDGTEVVLSYRRGEGENFGASIVGQPDFVATTFDDRAGQSVADGSAPFDGTFKPESPLSALFGKAVNGTWRLRITDAASGDTGTLLYWSLQITYVNE